MENIKYDFTLETIIKALDNVEAKYEKTPEGLLVKGKLAGVKTKVNKGLKELNYKIVKAKGGYFGEFEFKHILYRSTTGGFDMREKNEGTLIYSRDGVGYTGQD